MTDIEAKRAFVEELYPGPSWKRRVKNMSDGQVVAIYLRNQDKKTTKSEEHTDDPPPF